jgi:diaminopropionate ammonia-lyase
MRRLARPSAKDPPVVAGESGAAGLAGVLALLEAPEFRVALGFLHLGPATRLLVINTEGATDPEGYRQVVEEDDSALR